MMRTLIASIVAIALAGLVSAPAPAAEFPAVPAVTLTTGAVQGFSGQDLIGKAMSPLFRETGYGCRRDCDWCRNDCYARFRVYCYGANCRRQFTLCMRGCWNNICRYC